MHCFWCLEDMQTEIDWSNFLFLRKPTALCEACSKNLQVLTGKRCKKCSRETTLELCQDCQWWQRETVEDPLLRNHSIFHYNKYMQDVVAKWKYRGDYVLANIFKPYVEKEFMKIYKDIAREAIIMPIPLSTERMQERAFNQAEAIANFLPGKQQPILQRKRGEKQSKKKREERIRATNPFTLAKTINKPVVLVDDIYTTGATLRHAAQLLKDNGCPAVYAFTLIRG